MKLTSLGSSSFIIEISGIRILTDPWFWGKGFINGWSPLWKLPEDYDFGHLDYIWFSHEHPDHFHPATLNLLIPELKTKPTILFQETLNGRVAQYLRTKHNVKVLECRTYKTIELNKDVKILIGDVGIYDSYIQIKDGKYCFTHINDCTINKCKQFNKIKKFCKNRKHIITSQYGLANGPCRKFKNAELHMHKIEKLKYYAKQVDSIIPDYAIPSSRAIHFSCHDNQWMNEYSATPSEAIKLVKNKTAISLYPTPNKTYDFEKDSTLHYTTKEVMDFENLLTTTMNIAEQNDENVIPFDELKESFIFRTNKIKHDNNIFFLWILRFTLKIMKTIVFHISDLQIHILADPLRQNFEIIPDCKSSVKLNSFVMNQLYRSPYSVDSLNASARYNLDGDYTIETLNDHLNIVTLNAAGIYISLIKLLNFKVLIKLMRVSSQWLNFKFS